MGVYIKFFPLKRFYTVEMCASFYCLTCNPTRVKTHNLLQVVNMRKQGSAAPCEQCCAAPCEQCCAAHREQCCAAPREQCCAAPREQCCAAPREQCCAAPREQCCAAPI